MNFLALVLVNLLCLRIDCLIIDAIAEYFLTMKDMKMDKEEVKREMKEQEGTQSVKSKDVKFIWKFARTGEI